MQLILIFMATWAVGSAQAQEKCLELFEVRYFENTFENNNAIKLMEMFARHSTAAPGTRPIIDLKIKRIYQDWEREVSRSERIHFPVQPLHMRSEYYGENYWPATLDMAVNGKTKAPYLTQRERNDLQIEMSRQGLVFSSSRQPVKEILSGDFVVSLDQKIYLHHDQGNRASSVFYKHSSILLSAPVLFAGELRVGPQGQILHLTNKSGHYWPSKRHFRWVKEFLADRGFQFPEVPPLGTADSGSD